MQLFDENTSMKKRAVVVASMAAGACAVAFALSVALDRPSVDVDAIENFLQDKLVHEDPHHVKHGGPYDVDGSLVDVKHITERFNAEGNGTTYCVDYAAIKFNSPDSFLPSYSALPRNKYCVDLPSDANVHSL